MGLCVYCKKRASRFCIGVGAELCPQCCGRYRRMTIECSDNCRYLLESRKQALKKIVNVYGSGELELQWFELLHNLRFALVQVKLRAAQDMIDKEVAEALSNVIESRRIQEKGLIYECKSVNPNVQQAANAVLNIISQYEKRKVSTSNQFDSKDLNNCLKYLLRQVEMAKVKGVDYIQLALSSVGTKLINIGMDPARLSHEAK